MVEAISWVQMRPFGGLHPIPFVVRYLYYTYYITGRG
jgi:hypothetical protein